MVDVKTFRGHAGALQSYEIHLKGFCGWVQNCENYYNKSFTKILNQYKLFVIKYNSKFIPI